MNTTLLSAGFDLPSKMVDVLASANIRTICDLAEFDGGRRGLATLFDLTGHELERLDDLVRISGMPTQQWFG